MAVVLIFAIIFAFISYAVGAPKGYGALGAVLGFCFSLIGLIIVAVLPPSATVVAQRSQQGPGAG